MSPVLLFASSRGVYTETGKRRSIPCRIFNMPDKPFASPSINSSESTLSEVNPLAIKAVADAVMDLNIARKNMLIYPSSHEQVQRSQLRACRSMWDAAQQISPLTLTVMQECLVIDRRSLDEKNTVFKELAGILKQRSIAALTILPDFTEQEWVHFLGLLILDPEQIKHQGGISSAAFACGLKGIILHAVDYSKLHVTEESEIQRTSNQFRKASTWGVFVSHLVAGALAGEKGDGQRTETIFDPSNMAELLNTDQVDTQQAIDYYKTMIAGYLGQAMEENSAPASSVTGLERFHQLVQDLRPELQEQFLSAAFDQCVAHESSVGTEGFVGSMTDDLVVRMLRQANNEGKQISPSLMAFIKKMSAMSGKPAGDGGPASIKATQKEVQSLLDREDYDAYVDETYAQLLKAFSDRTARADLGDDLATLKSEIDADLEEPYLAIQVAFALKGLMAASMDVEEYRDWARQLTFMLDDLIIAGAYDSLKQIFDFIQQERKSHTESERDKICSLVLDHFNSTAFLATTVVGLNRPVEKVDPQALTFAECLGESLVAEAIESLGNSETLDPNSALLLLVKRSASQATKEALDRLRDARPAYVCRMLEIVRFLACREGIEGVKTLLTHDDTEVRMAALTTLLSVNNPWGVLHLREMLAGPWSPLVQRGMQVAGYYKIREIVPTLVAFVERAGPVGPDIARREAALRTLGKIGDPQAVAVLTKIARRRWSLSQKHLQHLKRVLFESLDGYAYGEIKDLLHIGLRQKDQDVVIVCRRLMKKHHRTIATGRGE